MKTYGAGFLLAVIGNVVLASVLAGVWWHSQTSRPTTSSALEAMPTSNTPDSTQSSMARAAAMPEMPVPPLQISRERLQSIGVKTGAVKRKVVEDEIRTTGNVVVDESRVAYVQLRYSGYIQKVFVDATHQYVRKGQPLFTIYSPDILTTERDYLAAKQACS